jgi:putative tryptophan/tyrosine transport system substrate-binding protein
MEREIRRVKTGMILRIVRVIVTMVPTCLALGAILLALSFPAQAQEPMKIRRIGFLAHGFPPPQSARVKAFHQGLRELGYIVGKNVMIEYRYAGKERGKFPALVQEIVRLKVDVIVTASTASIRAAKDATTKIPIVMFSASDPVTEEFVDSLARPGGNITGVSGLASELSGKLLELLTEAVPGATRVGVLSNPFTPNARRLLREMEIAAQILKLQLQTVEVQSPSDFNKAFLTLAKERADSLMLLPAALFSRNQRRIAELAVKNRLAAIYWRRQFAEAGGLMAYGPSVSDLWRRAGMLVGKILKGAKPADLPVEQAMKFELVINLKTAKLLGLTIPPHILIEADKVIQ